MTDLEAGCYRVDAVVCLFALIHVDRKKHGSVFQTLRSFLTPDGLLLATLGIGDWEGQEDFLGTPMAWSHYGPAISYALIEEAGFKIVFRGKHPGNLSLDHQPHPIVLAKAL